MPTVAAILGPLLLLASEPDSCALQEEALRTVAHDLWLGYNRRDTALVAKVLDNQLLFVPATGSATTKAALLTHLGGPPESMQSQSDETLKDVRTTFAGKAALLSFRRRVTITHQPSGVSFRLTSRMTEVFVCRGGEWKVLAFQETPMPNAERPVSAAASARRVRGPRSGLRAREMPSMRRGELRSRSRSYRAKLMRSSRVDSRSRNGSCAERRAKSSASFTPWAIAKSRRSGFRRPDPGSSRLAPAPGRHLP
jgi:ketosteroid isomerase-like protein